MHLVVWAGRRMLHKNHRRTGTDLQFSSRAPGSRVRVRPLSSGGPKLPAKASEAVLASEVIRLDSAGTRPALIDPQRSASGAGATRRTEQRPGRGRRSNTL